MVSICKYRSPLGDLLLTADEEGLTGLWFVGQKYYAHGLPDESIWQETKILTETRRWLDTYCLLYTSTECEKTRKILRLRIKQVK